MNRSLRSGTGQLAAALLALLMSKDVRAENEASGALVAAQPRANESAPVEQVIVLRDGGMLVGSVEQIDDRYKVTHGSIEMRVPVANVAQVASSLENAYQLRRKTVTRPTAEAHLGLAEWCLRHGLVGPAAQELAEARTLDAGHAQLEFLERRLALTRQHLAAEVARSEAPATEEEPVAATLAEPDPSGISELPPGAVELFTRKVQPVLVNTCTTSGCHQSGSEQAFQLDRAVLHGMSNRRTTMQNLSAALKLIDLELPHESRLLTIPRQSHAGMDDPLFGIRQDAAFRHLADWVALVTKETAKPAAHEFGTKAEIDLASADIADSGADETSAPSVKQSVYETLAVEGDLSFDSQSQAMAPIVRHGVQLQRWRPRDEFDPEIFNRRYSTESAAVSDISAPAPPTSTGRERGSGNEVNR